MTKDQIKAFLRDKPGYLKEGAERLSERLDCSVEACRNALKEALAFEEKYIIYKKELSEMKLLPELSRLTILKTRN